MPAKPGLSGSVISPKNRPGNGRGFLSMTGISPRPRYGAIDVQKGYNVFYLFHQNNSGGHFREPAEMVIVEASCVDEANRIAATIEGIYFDGYGDCPCCGYRWNELYDDEDGTVIPMLYGEPIHSVIQCDWWAGRSVLIRYATGQTEMTEIKKGQLCLNP